jgi:hypothetical protein
MEIALIVCGVIYLITVIYNFVASKAVNSAVKRKLSRSHPELVGKKPLRSASEIIIAIIPAFIPILHNLMALSFLFRQEYLIEQTYNKMIIELTNY